MKDDAQTDITKKNLSDALSRIKEYIHNTPVFTSRAINNIARAELYFKCENLQKVGAFKARGALNAALLLPGSQRKRGLATHSSGNHAQALALAAKLLGVPAYIVMPSNSPIVKKDAVRDYGAEITECAPNQVAREKALEKVVDRTGATFIPPYNHRDVIAGQATATMELVHEIPGLDYVIAPVGGGGLVSGAILACRYFSRDTAVMGAEPAGADDAFRSLKEGKLLPSENPETIADGLLTSLGEITYEIICGGIEGIITVGEKEIEDAMKLLAERMKLIVEPSGAVSLAAALSVGKTFKNKKIGIIISGGNIDLKRFGKLVSR